MIYKVYINPGIKKRSVKIKEIQNSFEMPEWRNMAKGGIKIAITTNRTLFIAVVLFYAKIAKSDQY